MGLGFKRSGEFEPERQNFCKSSIGRNKTAGRSNHKRVMNSIISCFALLLVLSGCQGKEEPLQSITIKAEVDTVDVEQSIAIEIKTDPSTFDKGTLHITSSDESIVKVDGIRDDVALVKTMKKEGTISLRVDQKDGKQSNEITLHVVDKAKKEQEQKAAAEKVIAKQKQKEAEERKQKEVEQQKQKEKEKQLAEQKAQQEKQAQQEKDQKAAAKQQAQEENARTQSNALTVYISPTGKKYHAIPKCGNMQSARALSLSDAQAQGYGACKKCY